MPSKKPLSDILKFQPVTPKRWQDLERLFGQRGACGGCWCMWFRMTRSDFEKNKGAGNKKALKKIVDSGQVPGILTYHRGEPIGWCSVGPRESFSALERSRILKRVDDRPAWSVVCFVVNRTYRGMGVSAALLKAAVEYAKRKGTKIIEGYPVEPRKDRMPDVFAYYGFASTFRQAGFKEVARRSETRPFMRYFIQNP